MPALICEPQLAPPGAGLPKIELLISRLLVGLRARLGNRASFAASFSEEREKIHALTHNLSDELASRRVLIAHIPGLEDSSRFWSVWMTLDHLRIVNLGMAEIIQTLCAGRTPERATSTAAVKPNLEVNSSVVADYEASCDKLLATVAACSDLQTKLRHAHPWFGPMDAHAWFALSAGHMGIHRTQIERILAGAASAE